MGETIKAKTKLNLAKLEDLEDLTDSNIPEDVKVAMDVVFAEPNALVKLGQICGDAIRETLDCARLFQVPPLMSKSIIRQHKQWEADSKKIPSDADDGTEGKRGI